MKIYFAIALLMLAGHVYAQETDTASVENMGSVETKDSASPYLPEAPVQEGVSANDSDQYVDVAETLQEDSKTLHGTKVYIGGGISQINHSAFNSLAVLNNFPSLREGVLGALNLGFIFKNKKNKLFSDYSFSFILSSRQRKDDYKLFQSGVDLELNVDYALVETKQHLFYPSLGIGWLSTSVNYKQNLSGQTFAQAMSNISGERTFTLSNTFYLNPRLTYYYKLGKSKNSGIGVAVGYRVGINNAKWKTSNRQKLTDAPKGNANGFYAGLNFCF